MTAPGVSRALAMGAWVAALAIAHPAQAAACHMQQLLQLPVTMIGTRPTVPMKINGTEGRFLLDSGAFFSVIDPQAMKTFGLRGVYQPRLHVGGVGGQVEVQSTLVREVLLGGAPFRNMDFLVADGAGGGGTAGMLGQNILGAADVEYDLANGVVRIFRPKDCGSAMLAYWSGGQARSLDLLSDSPTLTRKIQAYGALNGQKIRMTFDTGADRSVLTLRAAARAGVTPKTAGTVFAGQSRGIGRDLIDTWIAPFDRFDLGGEAIQHTRMQFGRIELDDTDMLLGADFFLSHRIYVSNSQHRIYFTYNGGPVFQLNAPVRTQTPVTDRLDPGPAEPAGASDINVPTDAAGFERRGAAFMSRRDFGHAIEDFTRAIALDPADPKPIYSRGMARWDNRQAVLAMSDFDRVLTLKPEDAPALIARGSLYAQAGDKVRAQADFQAASRIAGLDPLIGLAVGDSDYRFGFYDEALTNYDRWIAANPKADLGPALEHRCRTRVMIKIDLDKALADCSAALKLNPHDAIAVHMRGLTHYLRAEYPAAIVDLDAGLALQPRNSIGLYVRGLSKQKTGQAAAGDADIQAATAIFPKVADQSRQLGFAP